MTSVSPRWLRMMADFVVRWRWTLLALTLALTALSWSPASRLTLEQSIESLYSERDPHLQAYLESKASFGGDEFVIVAFSEPNVLDPASLRNIRGFAERLSEVPGVNPASTQHLAKALDFSSVPFFLRPLFNERMRSQMIELSRGLLIGSDDATTAVVLRLLPREKTPLSDGESFENARARSFRAIRKLAAEHDPPAFVAGEPAQIHDMFRYVEEDGELLFWWSLALLAAVQLVFFRNVRFVALGIAVVVVTIVWTKAILVLLSIRLSMVSSMLNSLVTIVGIATVTHVLMFYREQRQTADRENAFRTTFIEMAPCVLWTCVTTAAGFASLLSSDVTPVRSFGTILALGTMLVLVTVGALLPGGVLIGRFAADASAAPFEKKLTGALGFLGLWVDSSPRTVVAATFLLVTFTAAGFARLEVETDFSRNFRSDSPIVRALDFVETRLGGAGSWEVNFPAPDRLDDAFVDKVRRLTAELRALEINGRRPITKVVAVTDVLDMVRKIPFRADTIENKLDVLTTAQPEYVPSLYNAERKRMRLVLRALERQPSADKLQLIRQVEDKARAEFGEAKATGLFVLLTFIIDSLLRDQLVSFTISATSIWAVMALAFGSFRIGFISLAPNIIPNVLLIGALGWLRVPVNIGTAMIASVSMGITVDASVHYLAGVRRLVRSGMTLSQALHETQKGIGLALVFATAALVVGFSVLAMSHFIPLVYFGVLVSLAMFGGLIGNLVLLPLLLKRFGGHWCERTGRSDIR